MDNLVSKNFKKALEGILSTTVATAVSIASVKIAKNTGIQIDQQTQGQVVVAGTIAITGLISGIKNWVKHRKKSA